MIEVTITHNLSNKDEVATLWDRKLIALDWGRKGPDPEAYLKPAARRAVELFHLMRKEGAAVIAAYKGVTPNRADRLIGYVEHGAPFVDFNGLLCLPLACPRVIDSGRSFLGNLAPRQCTIQRCEKRARGRLAALASGAVVSRSVWSLHHHDVEWLVNNYLISHGICTTIWSGSRCFEDIDHVGITSDGVEVLAQTTVSNGFVRKKGMRLLAYSSDSQRQLHMFGPADALGACPAGIIYHAIETVFTGLDETDQGRWLIDRMLTAAGT